MYPKNPFVCPKEGITVPLHSYSKDGIETRKILFNREGFGFLGVFFFCGLVSEREDITLPQT